jgi:hypothetical protein
MKDNLERLVLYMEGELPADEAEKLKQELATNPELQKEYEDLKASLTMVSSNQPHGPGDEYFRHFYSRLKPKLDQKKPFWTSIFSPLTALPRLGYTGAMAAILVAFIMVAYGINTFLITSEELPSVRNETVSIKRNEGFMDFVTANHLEKSELLLREVYNISQQEELDTVALLEARRRGNDLLSANRSYRLAAEAKGNKELVELLNEIELILVDISNMDPDAAEYALPSVKRAIRKKNLLIKIEIINLNDLEDQTSRELTEVV